MRIFKKFL